MTGTWDASFIWSPCVIFKKWNRTFFRVGSAFFFVWGQFSLLKSDGTLPVALELCDAHIFFPLHIPQHICHLLEFFENYLSSSFASCVFLPSGFFFLGSSTALFQNFRDNDVFLQASCVDILVYLSNHSRLIFTRRPVMVCRNKLITSYYLLQLPQPTAAKACLVSHTLSSPSSSSQFHELSPQIALCPTM